ncbi:MAG: alpha/beta hydrolase [Propionibacteriaceae bacterium]|nr:alpha/beta hydrolase [Propionibacteriaceae bacterium]
MDQASNPSGLATMISKWRSVLTREPDSPGEGDGHDPAVVPPPPPSPSRWDDEYREDEHVEGFEYCHYHMPSRLHLPAEGEGHLISTLIRHHQAQRPQAVLHIHGWNEYFFQPHLAEFYESLGYDFYAVDLHRYGRSLQDDELPGYMESVDDYIEEIDACLEVIEADHESIILNGHSTGGLIASIYASQRPGRIRGLVLNSPWLDMQGTELMRTLTPILVRGLSVASPTMTLPASENHLYGESLHSSFHGEWEYDLNFKKIQSQPIRPGWVKAVVDGHDRVAAGLGIDCPVFVGTSRRSSNPKQWGDEASSTDLALDVERIAARVPLLGEHTTLVRFEGALHDVGLSRIEVRTRFFDEIRRWEQAYVSGK